MKTYGDDWLTDAERAQLAALRAKPRLSMYDQDDIDTFKMLSGLRAGIERMKKAGTLPKPYRVRLAEQRAAGIANDNDATRRLRPRNLTHPRLP
jgi:hypothetical protein